VRLRSAAKPRQDAAAGGRDLSPDELFNRMIAKARQRVIMVAAAGAAVALALMLTTLLLPAVSVILVAPFAAAALAVSACALASYEVARRVADAYSYKLYVRLTSAQPPPVREAPRAAEGAQVLVKPVVPAAQVLTPQAPPAQQPRRPPHPPLVTAQPTATTAATQRHEVIVRPVQPAPRAQAAPVTPASSPTCPQCGRELPYGDLHLICPFCGSRLK
jgi:hypothetical protein